MYRTFLGETIWTTWFPTVPDAGVTVPKQLSTLLYICLSKVRDAFVRQEDMRAEASKAFGVLVAQGRKQARVLKDAEDI